MWQIGLFGAFFPIYNMVTQSLVDATINENIHLQKRMQDLINHQKNQELLTNIFDSLEEGIVQFYTNKIIYSNGIFKSIFNLT